MALLEEEQLITAPHTSSGRVPTDKGYRLFVDRLSEVKPLSSPERNAIESFLEDSSDLDEVLSKTVRLLSQLTNQVALVQYPSLDRAMVRHVELVPVTETKVALMLISSAGRIQQHVIDLGQAFSTADLEVLRNQLNETLDGKAFSEVSVRLSDFEAKVAPALATTTRVVVRHLLALVDANGQDKLLLSGAANLARREGDFEGSITPVLEAIEEQVVLLKLISEMQSEQHGVGLRIGSENSVQGLAQTSVLVSSYENQGDATAKIGVIGPTRMDYVSNIAAVRAVARYLSRILGD
jgi:heat-inducible transcriptional repressor